MVAQQGALLVLFFAVLLYPFYGPVKQRITVLGITRPYDKIVNIHGQDLRLIPNTVQCEDLHLHKESGMLFTACQGAEDTTGRYKWFPPLEKFNTEGINQGSFYVVDPKVDHKSPVHL